MLAVGVLGMTAHADVSSAGWLSQASTAVVVDEAWTRSAGSRPNVGTRLVSRTAQRRLVWTRSRGSSVASTGGDGQQRTVVKAAAAKQVLWEQRRRQRELMSSGVR